MTTKKDTHDELRIESIIKVVSTYNKQALDNVDKRLAAFLKLFNKEFPSSDKTKCLAETVTWALFQPAISLYANGNNGAVIIELYSILEKFSIVKFPIILAINKNAHPIIEVLIEKKNLIDIAPLYQQLDIWSADDLIVINRLSKIRHGIAHKNENLISKTINNGKATHYLDIDYLASNHDTRDYIVKTLKLILKLTSRIEYLTSLHYAQ